MNTNEICQQLKEQAPEVRNIPQLMNSLMFLITEMDKTLKQTKIAELSGINPGLLRQYASGVKHPSPAQAKRIEVSIHQLADELNSVTLFAE